MQYTKSCRSSETGVGKINIRIRSQTHNFCLWAITYMTCWALHPLITCHSYIHCTSGTSPLPPSGKITAEKASYEVSFYSVLMATPGCQCLYEKRTLSTCAISLSSYSLWNCGLVSSGCFGSSQFHCFSAKPLKIASWQLPSARPPGHCPCTKSWQMHHIKLCSKTWAHILAP